MTTLSLPLAHGAAPAVVTIDDDANTHGVYDQYGNPTEPEELARLLYSHLPWHVYEGLLRLMLKREAEDDRDLGNLERAQVWSNAYNLAAGDGDAAFVDQRTIEDQHRALDIVLEAYDALAARARAAGVKIRDGWTTTVNRIRKDVRN